jgi:hypothetical protein
LYKGVGWFHLAQDRVRCWCLCTPSDSMICTEFIDKLSDYQLLKFALFDLSSERTMNRINKKMYIEIKLHLLKRFREQNYENIQFSWI